MLFRELLEVVDVSAAGGDPGVSIKGIAYDSRQVEPGFLFVAVQGFKADGHEFICQALERGAAAVVVQEVPSFLPPGTPWACVSDSRQALALISSRFYGHPSAVMKMVGVTGTNGKTTTTSLIADILAAAGQKVGLIGTVHNRIGARILPVKHTTPESTDLQKLLFCMSVQGVDTCVMEVSSHALALHRVDGCEFDVAVFTNMTQDHLDFHRDMDEYLESKLKLFSGLNAGCQKKIEKFVVINADDICSQRFKDAATGTVITFGVESPANVRAEDVRIEAGGASFTVLSKFGYCSLKLKITGMFNVYNTLAAFAASAAMGIPTGVIRDALENASGAPGRFELVDAGQDFSVIVDYAHTPDGLENVLKTARQIAKGRLITVFGCGGDRDRTKRPLMGAIAVKYSDYAIITSDNPRTEDPSRIIAAIEEGVRPASAKESYTAEPDRRKAIRLAINKACCGDVVVIAGKGHEDYQIIGTCKFPFDDRLEARAALLDVRSEK